MENQNCVQEITSERDLRSLSLRLTNELFVIPHEQNFILYAPLRNSIVEATPGTLGILEKIKGGQCIKTPLVEDLIASGIVVEGSSAEKPKECDEFKPTAVTLFPTSDCNLRCTYCYASAGETQHYMSKNTAKTAIDYILDNATDEIQITFHGGGEPFQNWDLVKFVVEYAKANPRGIKTRFTAGTNGVLPKSRLEWIADNFSNLTVSLDGTEEIQNKQRPLKNGKGSFEYVLRTIEYFEERGTKYSLRPTITDYSVGKMKEILDFFMEITTLKIFHFEPAFECGRCATTETHAPTSEDFIREFLDLQDYARPLGIDAYYSASRIEGVSDTFCGAAGRNFAVTAEGDVTSCYEVCSSSDPRSEHFYFGKIGEGVEIFQDKLDNLRSRVVGNIPHCTDCFAKYNCAGDCLAKVYTCTGDMFDASGNNRCDINRALLKDNLCYEVKNGKTE